MYPMPTSPQGRTIMPVDGDPDAISARGSDITTLGGQMRDSADLLEDIKTRASEQQGKAIEALRDTIGDSYTVLKKAADLYEPVGPVISQYGSDLADIQPALNSAVETCQERWDTYASADGSLQPRGTGGWGQPDEGSPEAEQQAEEDAAKKVAYDNWIESGEDFDSYYDTWEDAFDTAVDGITDKTSGTIKDGFWRSFLDGFSEILSWAALAAGIAALIFAGPFAAIALGLAAAYLAVTVAQYAYGDASVGDIAWAVVGVLPAGKVARVFQKGGGKALAGATRKGLSTVGSKTATAAKHPIQATKAGWRKSGEVLHAGKTKVTNVGKDAVHAVAHPRQAYRAANPMGFVDVMIRGETGMSATELTKASTQGWSALGGPGRGALGAVTEVGLSQIQQYHGYYASYNTVHDAVTGD